VHEIVRVSDGLPPPNPAGFHTLTRAAVSSPVHDAVSVQRHEVHLAAASRTHRCKEHLRNGTQKDTHVFRFRGHSWAAPPTRSRRRPSHLVVPLTKELQPLSSFVHEDAVQVAGLHSADLNGLLSPSHDLI